MLTETTEQHLDEIRGKVDQPEDDPGVPFWDLKELRNNYNRAWEDTWDECQEQDSGFFLPTTVISLETGKTEYDLPANHAFLRQVWYRNAGGDQDDRTPMERVSLSHLGHSREGFLVLHPDEFSGDELAPRPKIRISKGLANASFELEVLYGKHPYRLTAGTVAEENSSATKLTLDSDEPAIDDIFVGSKFYISSGTGAGKVVECIAYNGATKEITVTPAFTTKPDDTSTYTTLCPLPPKAVRVLILQSALNCLANEEAPKFKSVAALLADARQKMEYRIATLNRHGSGETQDTAGYLDYAYY